MAKKDLAALRIARDAMDLEPSTREDFITARCSGDTVLRARVGELLVKILEAERDAPSIEPGDSLSGTRLGPFVVHERIGRGGMGVVYRGTRDGGDFRQEVAIKLIRRGFDFDDIHERFLRERRILARLNHPGLARLIDGGTAPDGRPWFALEFVRGESIIAWCDRHRLGIAARLRLLLDVCAAVQYAHAQLVVHRDLKPGNVLVDETGQVRLLDFGIARLLDSEEAGATLTRAGSRGVFTPEYAAPEQFTGESAGVATDVYALGVMAYVLVSGVLPQSINPSDLAEAARIVREQPQQSLTQAILRDAPAVQRQATDAADMTALRLAHRGIDMKEYRKTVRGDLSRIIDKALAKEPERRYASVQAFSDDVSAWLRGAPVRVSGNAPGYRLRKFVTRHKVSVGFAALAVLALVAGLSATLWQMRETRLQRDEALAEVRRSEGMRQYLMLIFRDAATAGDAEVNVREVFRKGADRLFERFAGQPEAGQETALMLSDLFLQMADVQGAVPLLDRLIEWPGIESNPNVLAHARYNLAQAELVRGNLDRAQSLLAQAQDYWGSADGVVQKSLLNESRMTQSRLERAQGRIDDSLTTLRTAIAEREQLLGAHDVESGGQYVSLAVSLMQSGRLDEAEVAASDGLRVYEQLDLTESDGGLAALNARGNIAVVAGRAEQSIADFRRVSEMTRALYGETPRLATALNNLGIALMRSNQTNEAVPVIEEALRVARASEGERSRLALALRSATAEVWAIAGRQDDAELLIEEALDIAQVEFVADPVLLGTVYRVRARVRLEQGRQAEARMDIEQATEYFSAAGKAGEPYLRRLEVLQRELEGEPSA